MAWREIIELSKNKQGIAVALSLPEEDEEQTKDKGFDQISLDDLKSENGLNILVTFLDKHLAKDDLAGSLENKMKISMIIEERKGKQFTSILPCLILNTEMWKRKIWHYPQRFWHLKC